MKINILKILLFIHGLILAVNAYPNAMFVIDVEQIAKNADAHKESIGKLKDQIGKLDDQYKAMTGTRNMGNVLNDPQFRDYLPANWQDAYSNITNNGYSGLTPSAQQIYDRNKIFDACQNIQIIDERRSCEARGVKAAQDQALSLEAMQKSKNRVNQIEGLMKKIDETKDPKAINELQARIAAEQSLIANEQIKLQLSQHYLEAQERIQDQRAREIRVREASKTGTLNIKASDFKVNR